MCRLMSRLLKALPLTFALAALSIFSASCGSSNAPAQVRFVHAIQDAGALDIAVTGPNTASTPEFTHVSFLGVQPTQPGYSSVPSGGDTIAAVSTGTTTPVFSATATLGAGAHYTLVATGFSQTLPIGSNVTLLEISDNIPTPPSGDVEFRVIHASPSGPDGKGGAVDVYIELNPNTGPGLPIAIQGLTYTQASKYVTFTFNPNNATPPPGFTAYVTASGSTTPIFAYPLNPSVAGAVRTLVLTDVQNVKTMNSTFLELSDLN
jgi:Domain of unknown function (DUF4397)